MTRVTGKFQITLPKKLAETYGIKVGDEVELVAAGDVISLVPAGRASTALSVEERLREFDLATQRQRARERGRPLKPARDRGWTREDLYTRGRPR